MWALTRAGAALLVSLFALFASPAWAEKRVALIVGNAAYQNAAALTNPRNDAEDIAAALGDLGFQVILGTDLNQQALAQKVHEFAKALDGADVGLFFYAGHGLQVKGINYLVATDAKLEAERDLDFEAVRVEFVLSQMEREAKTNLVFLDACRNNPLARNLARTMGTRGVDENNGLAPIKSGLGTFIAFSTQPGNVASDGEGRNSPFTAALKKHIAEPGVAISDLLIDVRKDVVEETRGAQVPWDNSALEGRFYFRATPATEVPSTATVEPSKAPAPPVYGPDPQLELGFWNTVKDSNDPAELQAYLDHYPNGTFSGLAKVMIERAKHDEQHAAVAPIAPTQKPGPKAGDDATAEDLGQHIVTVRVRQFGEGNSKRGYIGIQIADLSEQLARAFGLASVRGALVTEVKPDGAAAQAGIKPLDVVTEFDGRSVASARGLAGIVEGMPPSGEARVVLWRFARSYQELTEALHPRAESGDAAAANALGWLYMVGSGGIKNEVEAVRWYRKGAEAGHTGAMVNLGIMYANGRGVGKDDAEAARWYRKGAEAGDVGGMVSLAFMYASGRGVAKDDAEAVRWYRKGAEAGDAGAMVNLGVMYANGRGVTKDDAEAVRWYRQGAEAGRADAMNKLGFMYENGRGVAQDEADAVRWYRKGAEAGNIFAMTNLGAMYATGRGVARDPATASQWMFKALQSGDEWVNQRIATNSQTWGKDFRIELQRRLKEAGIYDDPIDGEFGPSTQGALATLKQRAK